MSLIRISKTQPGISCIASELCQLVGKALMTDPRKKLETEKKESGENGQMQIRGRTGTISHIKTAKLARILHLICYFFQMEKRGFPQIPPGTVIRPQNSGYPRKPKAEASFSSQKFNVPAFRKLPRR